MPPFQTSNERMATDLSDLRRGLRLRSGEAEAIGADFGRGLGLLGPWAQRWSDGGMSPDRSEKE